MIDQRQIEITIDSLEKDTVFLADYQIDTYYPPEHESSKFELVGLWGLDADTGEEIDLSGLLKVQLPINEEIEQACIEHADKEFVDSYWYYLEA
jgi:hypothetical protein